MSLQPHLPLFSEVPKREHLVVFQYNPEPGLDYFPVEHLVEFKVVEVDLLFKLRLSLQLQLYVHLMYYRPVLPFFDNSLFPPPGG